MSFVRSSLPEAHEMQSMTKNTDKTLVNAAKEACMPLPENPQINQLTRLSLRALQARHVAINTANVSRLNSSLNLMLVTWMMTGRLFDLSSVYVSLSWTCLRRLTHVSFRSFVTVTPSALCGCLTACGAVLAR